MKSGRDEYSQNFILLDGVRGLGAIVVLYGHSWTFWGGLNPDSAAMCVDLFFLLSGFVIAYSYEPKLRTGMNTPSFMLLRLVRLYPLYLLGIVLGYLTHIVMAIGDQDFATRIGEATRHLIPHLFGLPSPQAGAVDLYPLNGPAWTLFFEMGVNLVYVAAFRWLRDTRILACLVAACAVALAVTVTSLGEIDIGAYWASFWAGFVRAGFGFFAGVLAYRMLGSPRSANRPPSKWALAPLFAVLIVAFVPTTPELRPFTDLGLYLVVGLLIIMIGPTIAPPKKYEALFVLGGRLSYAIYILHMPIRDLMERLTWRYPEVLGVAVLPGVALMVVVVALAYFAERYYDRPMRSWINGRIRAYRQRRAEQAAAARFAE